MNERSKWSKTGCRPDRVVFFFLLFFVSLFSWGEVSKNNEGGIHTGGRTGVFRALGQKPTKTGEGGDRVVARPLPPPLRFLQAS